ncbi:MAG: internalization-related competence protein ComEC/Rec2 protein [Candidatus Woesebacteria bacterium GW2011_GWA1_39_21]|uniref:Internalization-related competence protein ComEC/Rec2 protein n=1 Tax=Candidatus Woesebacteria bacterium GW2011_GWA1_39_21 TaxID=1618550 RepID=A0A0G0N4R7_9BACT|nr:MAG: internalization-related competence protein ComEC/Rec2 protein [Candidatus Woesebacteria bacterium GW2011_GWA1_39_21]
MKIRFGRNGLLVTILFLAFFLRIFFYFSNLPKYVNGTKLRITTRVLSEAIIYSTSQYLKLMGYKLYLPLYPRIYYGDKVIIEGIVEDQIIKSAKLISIDEKRGILYQYRQKIISFFERSLPKSHAALVAGITIGSKSGIGEELWNKLKNSGTAHVVVASGMNVSLVASFLISILILFLPRRKASIFALIGIWIYAVVSGFDAPIVRATIMGSTSLLAVETGRIYKSLRVLVITGLFLLFVKPEWIGDLGFWLTTFATGSIIVFYRRVKKLFKFVPKIINEDWSTTVSAQIGVVPLLYYFFGQFNLLSPVINVAVLWTVVPITIIGMVGGIVGTIFEPLGRIILYLCYPLTSWFLAVVNFVG